jgi:peptidoglycan/LPS O-acetylase OafA/YrhL
MRSTSGEYYQKLDHVRALAAVLVFFWHFIHLKQGVPFSYVPVVPFASLLDEGHTGVALFMTLSGYLFARLTRGQGIRYPAFYWNRFIRLAPLLAAILVLYASVNPYSLKRFLYGVASLYPWPWGAWSIAVEMHFYLLFPILLLAANRYGTKALLLFLGASIALRLAIWINGGNVRYYSYWTIAGCFDYFVIGMVFARQSVAKGLGTKTLLASIVAITAIIHLFNAYGGYHGLATQHYWAWIILPTLQATAWGALIASYERSSIDLGRLAGKLIAWTGEISYSIYLIHFPFLQLLFWPVYKSLVGLPPTSFISMSMLALAVFPLVSCAASLTYLLIERPFLRLRKPYKMGSQAPELDHAWAESARSFAACPAGTSSPSVSRR